jgi:hypothetical protein
MASITSVKTKLLLFLTPMFPSDVPLAKFVLTLVLLGVAFLVEFVLTLVFLSQDEDGLQQQTRTSSHQDL